MSETEQPMLDIWDDLPPPARQSVLATLGSIALRQIRPAPPVKEASDNGRKSHSLDNRACL